MTLLPCRNCGAEIVDGLNTLRKLLPALLVVTPFAFAWWVMEKPLRRMVPIISAELLVLAGLAYYHDGVLPL